MMLCKKSDRKNKQKQKITFYFDSCEQHNEHLLLCLIVIERKHYNRIFKNHISSSSNYWRTRSTACTMSGYRSIHRETIGSFPIWKIASSPVLTTGSSNANNGASTWRIWIACGDGIVRGYLIVEKSLNTKTNALDAAACNVVLTHVLLGESQNMPSAEQQEVVDEMSCIGCSHVQVARNYTGDDDAAGDLIIVSSDLSGKIRIWVLPEDMDNELPRIDVSSSDSSTAANNSVSDDDGDDCADKPASPKIAQEFCIENATGTCVKIMPPNVSGVGDIFLAVPCLDGTIAIVATGLSTPKSTKDPIAAGSIVERWSKALGSIGLSGDFHSKNKAFAVGRQDGLVEILGERSHRLIQHEAPVRSVSFTPDGNLLVTSSDDGMICVWDTSRAVPTLVQHVVQGHATWVLGLVSLHDSRRFLSCGADRQLHAWSFGQMDQPLHSFTSDDVVWAIDALTTRNPSSFSQNQTQTRLVTASENGGLHIYTLES